MPTVLDRLTRAEVRQRHAHCAHARTEDFTPAQQFAATDLRILTNHKGTDTMIDTNAEELITLSTAAKELPGRGSRRGVHAITLWRWSKRGIRGVKLETVLVGGIRCTSRQAIARFLERTTAAADGQPIPATTLSERRRAREAAERELIADGL